MVKTVNEDMTSHNGFEWPKKGWVEAPDWNPEPVCGGGLHGLLNGEGDGSLLNWSDTALWIIAKINRKDAVDLTRKIKVPKAYVVFCGKRDAARSYLIEHIKDYNGVCGQATASGNYGQATAFYGDLLHTGKSGISLNGKSDTKWYCTEKSIIILYRRDEQDNIEITTIRADQNTEHIGEIAVIENGQIIRWETEA